MMVPAIPKVSARSAIPKAMKALPIFRWIIAASPGLHL